MRLESRRRRLVELAVALAAALPYLGVLDAPFVFDDVKLVQENKLLEELHQEPGRILTIFDIGSRRWEEEELRANYRPLRFLSYLGDYALSRADTDGKTMGEELRRIGYAGEAEVGGRPVGAFFEAHIEQGPILEAERKTIGVVQGVQGIRWFEIVLTGQEAHAGPTPMRRRKDALVGASRMVAEVNRIGLDNLPHACATVGMMQVSPNSRNVIPGKVFFTVDFRHPDADTLAQMGMTLMGECREICLRRKLDIDFKEIWYSPPVKFNDDCVAAVQKATEELGFSNRRIVSGAGHDSVYMSRVTPTSMIFVPCKDGISHNEIEDAKQSDLAAGCDVLLRATIERANAA